MDDSSHSEVVKMRNIDDIDTGNPEAVAQHIYHGPVEFESLPRLQSGECTLTADHDGQMLSIGITPADRVGWSIRLWDGTLRAEGGWSITDRDGAKTDIELIKGMLSEMSDHLSARVHKLGEDGEWEQVDTDNVWDIDITDTSTPGLTDTLRKWLTDNAITEGEWRLAATAEADEIADSEVIVLPETR